MATRKRTKVKQEPIQDTTMSEPTIDNESEDQELQLEYDQPELTPVNVGAVVGKPRRHVCRGTFDPTSGTFNEDANGDHLLVKVSPKRVVVNEYPTTKAGRTLVKIEHFS